MNGSRLLFVAAVAGCAMTAWGQVQSPYLLPSVPDGYNLQVCDDCGVRGRQPHVHGDCAFHTYSTEEVNAPVKARSVTCGWRKIEANYEGLDPKQPYVLAVTYASEPFNNRVQSLYASGLQLHGPHELPKGSSERLVFSVPADTMKDGKLTLEFRLEGQANVVVSVVELWSPAPSPARLYLEDVFGMNEDLRGSVLDFSYDPAAGAEIEVTRADGGASLAKVQAGPDGAFVVKREALNVDGKITDVKLAATYKDIHTELTIPRSSLIFEPVKYRPLPSVVKGLPEHKVKLDGTWRIRTKETDAARQQQLEATGWGEFQVPGQWLQQGYDVPQDQPVAVAGQFKVPADWKDYRIFLRFDSIHAGTRYWVNGKELGYSENLFTPVEWEITDAVQAGQSNRLDLLMKVDTISEQLSYSSGYAFHSLGGIDRSVWIYALPQTHMRSLRILTDLDKDYRDGQVGVDIAVDDGKADASGLEMAAAILDENGKEVARATAPVSGAEAGKSIHLDLSARDPKKWTDEKPNLYTLALELKRGQEAIERVERKIGFRKIEIRGRQLYVNNRRVKLAGACHHETDPLTGRADTMSHAAGDLKLMKEANLNYVRTSHYPPPAELLDAADRLGLYVEAEAPFCWVGGQWDMRQAAEVLTPTSAMIDYCHSHPSVLIWSLANESAFRPFFETSNRLVKELDPTRPTTFNNPDPKRVCDVANLHYPPMPYENSAKDDNRPVFLGEYFFPVCHEQTDVRIDPGLRELWGAGHSEPDSAWGKECAKVFDNPPGSIPGGPSGSWNYICRSESIIGGAIWAFLDEPFYLPGGKHAGYYWVHGPWGLIDCWRRPKPEWWLSKLIFSPVWFPVRQAEWTPGQKTLKLPVENRFAFTNLNELSITWESGGKKGQVKADVPPAATGQLEIPVPANAKPTDEILLRVTDSTGRLINVLPVRLGPKANIAPPAPAAGAPDVEQKNGLVVITGKGFRLVLDEKTGELKTDDPRYQSALLRAPGLHLTRYDWGDFIPDAPRYEVLPNQKTRQVEQVRIEKRPEGVLIEIHDRYALFTGTVRWLIDRNGMSQVDTDYVYSGDQMHAREVGIGMALRPECDTLKWRRWSEWGVYPDDSISRTEGTAKARRDPKWPPVPERVRPSWPWSLDQTEQGTADFRSVKLNIYTASLADAAGKGVSAYANADAHVVARLADKAVLFHVLSDCRLGPVTLKNGDRVTGQFHLRLAETGKK